MPLVSVESRMRVARSEGFVASTAGGTSGRMISVGLPSLPNSDGSVMMIGGSSSPRVFTLRVARKVGNPPRAPLISKLCSQSGLPL